MLIIADVPWHNNRMQIRCQAHGGLGALAMDFPAYCNGLSPSAVLLCVWIGGWIQRNCHITASPPPFAQCDLPVGIDRAAAGILGRAWGEWPSRGIWGTWTTPRMGKGRRFSHFCGIFGPAGAVFMGACCCGNAALGRAGGLSIGPISLALRARLVFTRPLLIEIVQSIFGTHPQCVCCFPCHIIITLRFSYIQ